LSVAAPPAEFNVKNFGAMGNAKKLETASIQRAVDSCAAHGGGKVLIPAGRYVSGPIFLRSHVQVELGAGAILAGSTNLADYPVIPGRWEGIERKTFASLFTGRNLEHVAITGQGIIEGQGASWWEAHRKTMALRKKLGLSGREPENPPDAPLKWPRPRLINLFHCTNILIRDVTLQNSPSWNVHLVYCQNVTLDNLTITAPSNSPNTDAVDPDSCQNVRISNSHFDVGDDCIVIKSGYNEDGRRVGLPCENILVSNCIFGHGHGGVVIGSEMSGSVRNVTVVNCVFDGTERGLRVKTAPGRGGVVEHFRASNLIMRNIKDAAFAITAAYSDGSAAQASQTGKETIPTMRDIDWSDITVVSAGRIADFGGLPESPLENFHLRNINVGESQKGIRCENARDVTFENINIRNVSGSTFIFNKVRGAEVSRLTLPQAASDAPVIVCEDVSGLLVHGCIVTEGPGLFLQTRGEKNEKIEGTGNRLPVRMRERQP
jgi:polygalacturonase